MLGDSSELLPHFSFLIGRVPMATESEAGGKLPPGVGTLTRDVVKSRPDLSDMEGFTVRVPRSLDVESNDGPQRVWVQGPMDVVVEGKSITFPTIILSAAELLAVYRGEGGLGEIADEPHGADLGLQKTIAIQDPSRAEILNSEKSPASLRKGGGKSHAKPSASWGGAGKVSEREEVEEPIPELSEAEKPDSTSWLF